MEEDIDYSIHYKRWHNGSSNELSERKIFYSNFIGTELDSYSKNCSVLDYGCGFGHLTSYLMDRFDHVLGVDASQQQIAVALNNNLPVEHVSIDQFNPWIEDNQNRFDIIFLMDVLEHIPINHQIGFMRKINSILKKGGSLYIKVPNANSLLSNRWRYIDTTHYCSFTECSLEFLALNSGFSTFKYLKDETSLTPKFPFILRPIVISYLVKMTIRFFWKYYMYSEIGRVALTLPLGVNLFVKTLKVPVDEK